MKLQSDDIQNCKPAAGRTPEELRRVGLALASLALDLVDAEDVENQLSDVLAALGYRVKKTYEEADLYVDTVGRVNRYKKPARRESTHLPRMLRGSDEPTVIVTRQVAASRHSLTANCGDDRGTLRGYRRHLTSYNTPCADCTAARVAELDERWERLGIPSHARGGVKRW